LLKFYRENYKIYVIYDNDCESELIELKRQNPEFEYVLEVVIFLGDESPGLNFSERTIKFMNKINGTIDCDIYNEK